MTHKFKVQVIGFVSVIFNHLVLEYEEVRLMLDKALIMMIIIWNTLKSNEHINEKNIE